MLNQLREHTLGVALPTLWAVSSTTSDETSSDSGKSKKDSRRDRGRSGIEAQRITSVGSADQSGNRLFYAGIGVILIAGLAAIGIVASQRESNIEAVPRSRIDHWHTAYLVHNCGTDLPVTGNFETQVGIHTHGDGLLHIHPFDPVVSGRNATLGNYVEFGGGSISDEAFEGLITDVPVNMSEADGCGGEDAVLQLAYWENAFDPAAEPEVITENLADFRFAKPGGAITLALLPEGAEIPMPPAERIAQLATTGTGEDPTASDSPLTGSDVDTDSLTVDPEGETSDDPGTSEDSDETGNVDAEGDAESGDGDAESGDETSDDSGESEESDS